MKNILLAITLLFATVMTAQTDYKAENEGWLVDFKKAQAESAKTGKPILANFTGSDWCGWCKRLTRDVYSKPEFKKWAEKNAVLLELDFPKRKKLPQEIMEQNRALGRAFQVQGYPTVWVFFADEVNGEFNIDPVTKLGYQNNVKDFTGYIDTFIKERNKK